MSAHRCPTTSSSVPASACTRARGLATRRHTAACACRIGRRGNSTKPAESERESRSGVEHEPVFVVVRSGQSLVGKRPIRVMLEVRECRIPFTGGRADLTKCRQLCSSQRFSRAIAQARSVVRAVAAKIDRRVGKAAVCPNKSQDFLNVAVRAVVESHNTAMSQEASRKIEVDKNVLEKM